MATPELIEKKLRAVRTRMGETRTAFAALKTLNKVANKDDNEKLFNKLRPYWRFVAVTNQSLKAFVISNVVALGDPSSTASLYRICEDLKKYERSTASKRELGRWQNQIQKSAGCMKDYRHKFVSHIDQHAEDYVDIFNEEKYSWEDLQEPLDDLACMLERLTAAAAGVGIPSVEEIRLRIFGVSDYAIDAREHTAKFLADVQRYFPGD